MPREQRVEDALVMKILRYKKSVNSVYVSSEQNLDFVRKHLKENKDNIEDFLLKKMQKIISLMYAEKRKADNISVSTYNKYVLNNELDKLIKVIKSMDKLHVTFQKVMKFYRNMLEEKYGIKTRIGVRGFLNSVENEKV